MPTSNGLRAWLRLCRAEYWGFSVTAPLGALLVAGPNLPLADFFALFLINLLTVAWGFADNDDCDLALDRTTADKRERVLVRGELSPTTVRILNVVMALTSVALAAYLWGLSLPLGILLGSILSTALYNRLGKRFPGGDLFYALAGSLQFLLGATAALPAHDLGSISLPVLLIFVVQLLNHFYFNAVNGGVKDAPADHQAGIPTLAALALREAGDHPIFAPAFRYLAVGLALAIVAFTLTAQFTGLPWYYWQVAILGFCAIRSVQLTRQLVHLHTHDRKRIAPLLMRREMVTSGMIMMLLPAYIGLGWIATLLAIPLVLHIGFNRLLYGHALGLSRDY